MTTSKRKRLRESREEARLESIQNKHLCDYAAIARVVEFDSLGRVCKYPEFLDDNEFDLVEGLAKIRLPDQLFAGLCSVHSNITSKVNEMAQWAGAGTGTTRLRAYGFPDQQRLDRLRETGIRLHASEKEGSDAVEDEQANMRATIILCREMKEKAETATDSLVSILKKALPHEKETLSTDELISMQPNIHNGANYLSTHLDFPRHDGFGKIITTVAIKGSAMIVLIGPNDLKKAWRFRLEQGECYVLSGKARRLCLHGVLSIRNDIDGVDVTQRESLNLRFGLHSVEEAESEEWWENEKV